MQIFYQINVTADFGDYNKKTKWPKNVVNRAIVPKVSKSVIFWTLLPFMYLRINRFCTKSKQKLPFSASFPHMWFRNMYGTKRKLLQHSHPCSPSGWGPLSIKGTSLYLDIIISLIVRFGATRKFFSGSKVKLQKYIFLNHSIGVAWYVCTHCWYIEPRNREKSLRLIWQRFSCLLDEGIPKICKKLNSHGGFLRADQGRAKMCCQMGWIGCAI